jgi:RimJ/RimL family protein N-acetyltransferase
MLPISFHFYPTSSILCHPFQNSSSILALPPSHNPPLITMPSSTVPGSPTTAASQQLSRFAIIQTSRDDLILREFSPTDQEAFFRLECIDQVVRYQTYGPRTPSQAKDLVAEIVRNSFATPRIHVELAVEYREEFVGRVGGRIVDGVGESKDRDADIGEGEDVDGGLVCRSSSSSPFPPPSDSPISHADLWFSFLPSSQGKGVAIAAMQAFIPLLTLNGPLELEIEADPRNEACLKMAERLGFVLVSCKEKVFECKGEWVGSCVFRKAVVCK